QAARTRGGPEDLPHLLHAAARLRHLRQLRLSAPGPPGRGDTRHHRSAASAPPSPPRDRGFRATSRIHPLDLDTEARSRRAGRASAASVPRELGGHVVEPLLTVDDADGELVVDVEVVGDVDELPHPDRKSTRLNSSHVKISYAVFCLK